MSSIIDTLSQVLSERRTASPESSYTASLFAGGLSAISAKLHEELEEFIEAAENLESAGNSQGTDAALIHEAADLSGFTAWCCSLIAVRVLARIFYEGHPDPRPSGAGAYILAPARMCTSTLSFA